MVKLRELNKVDMDIVLEELKMQNEVINIHLDNCNMSGAINNILEFTDFIGGIRENEDKLTSEQKTIYKYLDNEIMNIPHKVSKCSCITKK